MCESFFDVYYDPEFGKLGTPRSVTNFSGEIPLSMNEMMPEMGLWSESGIATGTPAPSLELTVREVPEPFEPLYPGPQMSSMFGPAAYASSVYEIECDVVEVYPELDQMDLAQEPTPSVEPTRIAEPFLGTPTDLVAGIRPVEAAPPGLSVPHVWNEGTSMWNPVPAPLGYNGDRGVEEWLVTGFSKYALLAPGPAPLRVPDTTAPDAPSRLSGTMSGNTLWLSWTNPTDPDFDNTRVWMSTTRFAADANDTSGMTPMDAGKRPYASTTPPDGLFYFSAFSRDAAGNWSAGDYTSIRVGDVKTTRLADRDRFTTAVEIAREGFDPGGTKSWGTVTDVVIASGDDRAAADPLAAAGLCWLYDAPLFLVSADRTPVAVKTAIKEIAAANGPVTVHIVGGPVSVPEARYNDIKSHVGGANVSKDRLVSTGGRYDLAQAIAARMNTQASAQGKPAPSVALIANGADSTKFFDALALSTVAANEGAPILLVSENSVPWQTRATLGAMSPSAIYVGGGPKTVSASVYNQLGADDRWSGNDRYLTAIDIANEAQKLGLIDHEYVGVAAVLPDALTGGSMVGQKGGVLLITNGQSLTSSTGSWLSAHKSTIKDSYVFGGPVSVSEKVRTQIDQRLQ